MTFAAVAVCIAASFNTWSFVLTAAKSATTSMALTDEQCGT